MTVQKSIILLLKDLQLKYGMAILFITHDLGLISGIADDLLVMKDGKIVESGPVKEVFASPETSLYERIACLQAAPGYFPGQAADHQ